MACGLYEEFPVKKISASILECTPDKGRGDTQRRAYEIVDEKEDRKDPVLRGIIRDALDDNDYLYMYYEYMDRYKQRPESFKDLFESTKFLKAKRGVQALIREREEST